jgi:hypothetical protein
MPGNYYLHTYNWQSFNIHTQLLCTHLGFNTCGAFPLLFFPLLIPFCSPFLVPFTYLETLLAVTGSCPPRSQVACKLTSPFSTLPPSLPTPNSQYPLICASLRRLQEPGFSCPEQFPLCIHICMSSCAPAVDEASILAKNSCSETLHCTCTKFKFVLSYIYLPFFI